MTAHAKVGAVLAAAALLLAAALAGEQEAATPPASAVSGIGGVFLYANDVEALAAWYRTHLGIALEPFEGKRTYHTNFFHRHDRDPARRLRTVFALFAAPEPLPAERREARVNYRVDDLEGLVARLREAGIEVRGVEEHPYGLFAWTRDPEGNRIELWEPRGAAPPGEAADPAREEVLAALRAYYRDLSARDWEKFAGHFWPRATITTVWQPAGEAVPRVAVSTVPEFVARAPEGPGSKPIFEEWMTGAEVRRTGNLAQVWAGYRARFGEPGDVAEWSGTDAFTLMRHEGRWKIVALVFASEE